MRITKAVIYVFVVLISVVGLAEIYLRATDKYQVFSEMNGQSFYTEYGLVSDGWFHIRAINDSFVPAGVDFHYPYVTNRYGFRDKNYDTIKSPSVFRILVSGDSFAEGEGTPYDSTWPRIMEKFLREKGLNTQVIDAGVAGSDVFYDYIHYKEKLNELHPDLIIASLNSSDYTDYLTRGGMERFHEDGTTHLKPTPWYMPLFVHSRFVRAVLHKTCGYNSTGLFVSYKEYNRSLPRINRSFADVFSRYQTDARNNGAGFVAIIHTTPTEIKFTGMDIIKSNNRSLNQLADTLNALNIRCFNLSAPLYQQFASTSMEQLSYPHDFHYTPMAYAFMGKIISDSLLENGAFATRHLTTNR